MFLLLLVKRPICCQLPPQPGQRGDRNVRRLRTQGALSQPRSLQPSCQPPPGANFKEETKAAPLDQSRSRPPSCAELTAPTWPPVSCAHGVAGPAQVARVAAPPQVAVVRARDARQDPQQPEAPERRQPTAAPGRLHGQSAPSRLRMARAPRSLLPASLRGRLWCRWSRCGPARPAPRLSVPRFPSTPRPSQVKAKSPPPPGPAPLPPHWPCRSPTPRAPPTRPAHSYALAHSRTRTHTLTHPQAHAAPRGHADTGTGRPMCATCTQDTQKPAQTCTSTYMHTGTGTGRVPATTRERTQSTDGGHPGKARGSAEAA